MGGLSQKKKTPTRGSSKEDHDITALKREVSLLKSELAIAKKKKSIQNEIAEEGLFFHHNFKITESNIALSKITEFSLSDLKGMHLKDLFVDTSCKLLKKHINNDDSTPIEIYLRSRSGNNVFVHAKAKTYEFEDKIQQLVLVQNITELKKTRRSLEESDERHRRVSSLLSDYVYTCTIKPNCPPEIGWISGAIKTISGYTEEEIDELEGGWFSIIHPDDVSNVAESVMYNYKEDKFYDNEYRIIDKNGKIRWLRDRSMRIAFNPETKELTLLGATKDITVEKKIEESLRLKNLEFEKLNRNLFEVNQQLQESQQKYKTLIGNSVLGIGISYKEKILFANEALMNIYGIKSLKEFSSRKLCMEFPFC